jgi:sigma-E factor negative regulatory protein RseC
MVEEEGIVVEVRGTCALIKTSRNPACEKCRSRQFCISTDETEMLIEAKNLIDAKEGDRVLITIGSATAIKAGFMFYLLPLAGFIIGVLIGQMYISPLTPGYSPDLVSAASGAILLVLTFIGIRIYGIFIYSKKDYRPSIERII